MPSDIAPSRTVDRGFFRAIIPSDSVHAENRDSNTGGNPAHHKSKFQKINQVRERLGQAEALLQGRKRCALGQACKDIRYLFKLLEVNPRVNEGQYTPKKKEGAESNE